MPAQSGRIRAIPEYLTYVRPQNLIFSVSRITSLINELGASPAFMPVCTSPCLDNSYVYIAETGQCMAVGGTNNHCATEIYCRRCELVEGDYMCVDCGHEQPYLNRCMSCMPGCQRCRFISTDELAAVNKLFVPNPYIYVP